MAERFKKMAEHHWNCLPWLICGLLILIKGNIGRWAYGLTWVTVIVMIWHYCPTININRLSESEEDENGVPDEVRQLGIVEKIENVGTCFCESVDCNYICDECEHASLMKEIINVIKEEKENE